ncbi:unnamed protein product [Lampetra planeri]
MNDRHGTEEDFIQQWNVCLQSGSCPRVEHASSVTGPCAPRGDTSQVAMDPRCGGASYKSSPARSAEPLRL